MMFRRTIGLAAVVLAMTGGQAFAQTADENRDADALAADMRLLAANPLDIEALITAGELTLKMGDNTAAAGFFGRAEKLDPLNPRIKAGYGSLMVRAERPGEALRRFQEAEARGLDPRKYAADRGLAYDLIGEQERAQRDYRLALQAGPNDEVTRRYALSLGISGHKKEALDILDPLLRRNDRAAWRDRAFVLAMSGDQEGAQKIANSMMSPGLGEGLAPFFERLPSLPAADRAFAVNFGELRASPERIADARMAPTLPRLGPDPTAPRALAVAEPARSRPTPAEDKKRKGRRKDGNLAPAVPTPVPAKPPVEVALNPPRYVPPPTGSAPPPSPPPARAIVAPPPTPRPVMTPAPSPLPPVRVAEAPRPTPAPVPASPAPAVPVEIATNVAPAPAPGFVSTLPADNVADRPSAAEAGVPQTATSRAGEDAVLAKIIAGISVPATELGVAPMPSRAAPPPPAPKPVEPALEPRARPAEIKPPVRAPEPRPVTRKTSKEDAADGQDVRGGKAGKATTAKGDSAELDQNDCLPPARGRAGTRGKAAARSKPTAKCETADAKSARSKQDAATPDETDCPPLTKGKAGSRGKAAGRGRSAARCETADAKNTRDSRDDTVALDKNGCPLPTRGKSGARGKPEPAATTRGRAGAKGKASARCENTDAKDAKGAKADAATKGDTARIWVQVAGGANEDTLEKAWNAVKAKAPELFRGRQGWSTPLRATNRVLTGPFKTTEEAQDFVNRLGKAGLSGFVFSSAKGQKISPLGGK